MTKDVDVRRMLADREATYGGSYLLIGKVVAVVEKEVDRLLETFPEGYGCWIEILHKLLRLLGTPRHLDSWRDIAGYAILIVDLLEKEKHGNVR